jgi:phage repressor protein C with HTH and peptisase S24 domain
MSTDDSNSYAVRRANQTLLRMRHRIEAPNDASLAAFLGTSPKNVSNWRARGSIPRWALLQFAAATGVTLGWLSDLTGDVFDFDDVPLPSDESRPKRIVAPISESGAIDNEFVFIRHYDATGSMGEGIENGDDNIKHYNAYRRPFWQREIGFPPEECFSMDLQGSSMSPFLTDRHIPVFHREEDAKYDSVYVFRFGGENFVKKLQRIPGQGLLVSSYDTSLETWTIPDDESEAAQDRDFKVIGRLVFKQLGERV